jgi:uncharacterized protein YciI
MRYFLMVLCFLSVYSYAQKGAGRYTFVYLNTNPDRAELPQSKVDELQAGHMANIGRLIKERKMIAAGPFHTGGGIFIFDTNQAETEAVLSSDPAISANRFVIETYPFSMDMGEICTIWDKDESAVEMTTYFFMRFRNKFDSDGAYAMKTNRFTLDKLKEAQRKLPEIEILGDLNFDGNQGQVVIFKGDEDKMSTYEQFFKTHKGLQSGIMDFYIKQLYFAKGVFCED